MALPTLANQLLFAAPASFLLQVLSGHVHSYERSLPMYNYKVDACGVQYIVVGASASCTPSCF